MLSLRDQEEGKPCGIFSIWPSLGWDFGNCTIHQGRKFGVAPILETGEILRTCSCHSGIKGLRTK